MYWDRNTRNLTIILCVLIYHVDPRAALGDIAPTRLSAIIGVQQFATSSTPSGRMDFQGELRSESVLKSPQWEIPSRELHFYSFFETDTDGDKSFDFDKTLLRFSIQQGTFLWLGRTLPMTEGTELTVKASSAIGSQWVQNQSNPLSPRPSGWIGTGIHYLSLDHGVFLTAAYSPLFLPSFGPSTEFSETQEASGTRFSRLPPSGVFLNDQNLPLRYRIKAEKVSDIILRPQVFFETGHDTGKSRLSLLAWSAPSTSAHASASGILRVDAQDATVLATVVPDFPRETHYGARWLTRDLFISPALEFIYERDSRKAVFSASFSVGDFFQGGFLTTFQKDLPTQSLSPDYALDLAWVELQAHAFRGKMVPSLRIERHLRQWPDDQWILATFHYSFDPTMKAFASASILTGTDNSYFGGWRALDSVSTGVQYQW